MKAGLWKGKYAATNHHEYFAEGVQSWFDNNRENDHDHNHVNTRAELIEYDPGLAAMCREVFGDTELKYTKPATRLTGHMAGLRSRESAHLCLAGTAAAKRTTIRGKARAKRDADAKAARRAQSRAGRSHQPGTARQRQGATEKAVELLKAQLEEIIRDGAGTPPSPSCKKCRSISRPSIPAPAPAPNTIPDADWLRDNERDPVMAKGVEFTNIRDFEAETRRMPNFALHELAHAYHDRVLGFDESRHQGRLPQGRSRRHLQQRRAPGRRRPRPSRTAPTR